jgi:hypothetical protein
MPRVRSSSHTIDVRYLVAGDTAVVVEFGDSIERELSEGVLRLSALVRATGVRGRRPLTPSLSPLDGARAGYVCFPRPTKWGEGRVRGNKTFVTGSSQPKHHPLTPSRPIPLPVERGEGGFIYFGPLRASREERNACFPDGASIP